MLRPHIFWRVHRICVSVTQGDHPNQSTIVIDMFSYLEQPNTTVSFRVEYKREPPKVDTDTIACSSFATRKDSAMVSNE